jgi:hypothetical protein
MKVLIILVMIWSLVLLLDFHPIYPICLINLGIRFGLFLTIEFFCSWYLIRKLEQKGW